MVALKDRGYDIRLGNSPRNERKKVREEENVTKAKMTEGGDRMGMRMKLMKREKKDVRRGGRERERKSEIVKKDGNG